MVDIPKRRKHRGGRRHAKLKQKRQAEREARLQQQSHEGGGGGGVECPPATALFERPQEVRSDIRLVRQAVNQRWPTDANRGQAILEKVSRQALGEEDGPSYSPGQLIAAAKLHLDVERMNQADDHHRDRMDYHERALAARQGAVGNATQVNVNFEGQASDQPTSAKVYIPHNFRDELPPQDPSTGIVIYLPEDPERDDGKRLDSPHETDAGK